MRSTTHRLHLLELRHLEQYLEDLFQMLDAYEQAEASVSDGAALARIRSLKADLDIDYLKEDIPNLMRESRDGIQRVRKIVQDLKDFSRVDARQEWESVDLHAGIDSTLNIVNNEIKYKADVVKHYGALPEIQCLPSELNQVFMNLLVNAAHAITAERGTITISTGVEGPNVWVEVADTGAGIAQENLKRILTPSSPPSRWAKARASACRCLTVSCKSTVGAWKCTANWEWGTRFRITLPIKHEEAATQPAA